jgi:hypothetical protein
MYSVYGYPNNTTSEADHFRRCHIQTIRRQAVGCVVDDENDRILKAVVVACEVLNRHLPGGSEENLYMNQDKSYLGQDSKRAPPDHNARALPRHDLQGLTAFQSGCTNHLSTNRRGGAKWLLLLLTPCTKTVSVTVMHNKTKCFQNTVIGYSSYGCGTIRIEI